MTPYRSRLPQRLLSPPCPASRHPSIYFCLRHVPLHDIPQSTSVSAMSPFTTSLNLLLSPLCPPSRHPSIYFCLRHVALHDISQSKYVSTSTIRLPSTGSLNAFILHLLSCRITCLNQRSLVSSVHLIYTPHPSIFLCLHFAFTLPKISPQSIAAFSSKILFTFKCMK